VDKVIGQELNASYKMIDYILNQIIYTFKINPNCLTRPVQHAKSISILSVYINEMTFGYGGNSARHIICHAMK